MRNHSTSRNAAFFAAGAFTAALFIGGAAQAITDTVFKYSTPQTGFLQIPNGSFVAETSTSAYSNNTDAISIGIDTVTTCFQAPVNLPAGAKMTELDIAYQKANGTSDFTVLMVRRKMSDATSTIMFSQHLANTGYKVAHIPITTLQLVDNQQYSYAVELCMNSTSSFFRGARIVYTYTNAGN